MRDYSLQLVLAFVLATQYQPGRSNQHVLLSASDSTATVTWYDPDNDAAAHQSNKLRGRWLSNPLPILPAVQAWVTAWQGSSSKLATMLSSAGMWGVVRQQLQPIFTAHRPHPG
jgi:hypothetical protein